MKVKGKGIAHKVALLPIASLCFAAFGAHAAVDAENAHDGLMEQWLPSSIHGLPFAAAASNGIASEELFIIKRLYIDASALDEKGNPKNQILVDLIDQYTQAGKVSELGRLLLPDTSGMAIYGALDLSSSVRQIINNRMHKISNQDMSKSSYWIDAIRIGADQRSSVHGMNRYEGYEAQTLGFVFGHDTRLNQNLRAGAAISLIDYQAESDVTGNKVNSFTYTGSVYASYQLGHLGATIQGLYGLNDMEIVRNHDELGLRDADGRPTSVVASVAANLDYSLYLLGFDIKPSVSLAYDWTEIDSYSELYVMDKKDLEKGSAAAFEYKEQFYDTLKLGAAVNVEYPITSSMGTITPMFEFGAEKELLDTELTTTARLRSGGEWFTIGVAPRDDVTLSTFVGVRWQTTVPLAFDAGYQSKWSDDLALSNVYLSASYLF